MQASLLFKVWRCVAMLHAGIWPSPIQQHKSNPTALTTAQLYFFLFAVTKEWSAIKRQYEHHTLVPFSQEGRQILSSTNTEFNIINNVLRFYISVAIPGITQFNFQCGFHARSAIHRVHVEFMEAVKRDCMHELWNECIRVPGFFKVYLTYFRRIP